MPVEKLKSYVMLFIIKSSDKRVFVKYRDLFKKIFKDMGILSNMPPPELKNGIYTQTYVLENIDIAYDALKHWGREIGMNGAFRYKGHKIVIPEGLSLEVKVELKEEKIVRSGNIPNQTHIPKRSIPEEFVKKYGMKNYTVYIESLNLDKLKTFTKELIDTMEKISNYIAFEGYFKREREGAPTHYIAKVMATLNTKGLKILLDLKKEKPNAILIKEGFIPLTREEKWERIE